MSAPERIGEYRIVRSLAVGGSAEVFLAVGLDQKRVALKLLLPFFGDEAELIRAFHAEALLVMGLQHPNIARALSVAREGDNQFIVMEFVDGPTLGAMLARGPVPLPIAVSIVDTMARALGYAHETLKLVHRDLTPFNVMIGSDGVVKVTDFGTAKAALNTARTRTGVLKGQFAYMSPEHARGKPVDARSDIFSLGLLAYEMTTGQRAYASADEGEVLRLASAGAVPPFPAAFADASAGAFTAVVARALRVDPAERFQTCADLVGALDDLPHASEKELSLWIGAAPTKAPRRACPYLLVAVAALLAVMLAVLWPKPAPLPAPASLPAPIALAASAPAAVEPPPVVHVPRGFVTINTRPWSKVSIDGQTLGSTPLTRHSIMIGKHRVTLVRPSGEKKNVELVVREGAVTNYFYDW